MLLLPLLAVLSVVVEGRAVGTEDSTGPLCSDPGAVSGKSFTYVVVGGGTAGLTVAARLTENPDHTALVLEAGSAHLDDPLILTPAEVGVVYGNPDYDWNYVTIPQVNANNVAVNFTRGRVLGGSSALNAMIWDRSSKAEFDLLPDLGNEGWGWDRLLPYMKKPERFTPPVDRTFSRFWNQTFKLSTRGLTGQIETTFTNSIPDAEIPVEAAALSLGLDLIPDPMGGDIAGTWRSTSSIDPKTRTRSYAVTGYLLPYLSRKNLFVLTGAQVSHITWEKTSAHGAATASGVSFIANGRTYSVKAFKEVILSAGSVGSPQILELSGVGQPQRLINLGIKPIVNLPNVGENMQEHIYVSLSYKTMPDVLTFDRLFFNDTFAAEQAALFAARPASGALSYTANSITFLGLHFIPSFRSLLATTRRQISRMLRTPGQVLQQQLQLRSLESPGSTVVEILTEGLHISPDAAEPNTGYESFLVLLQKPFSRGSTHIKSNNILDHPLIDPNYFSVDFDIEVLALAAQFVRSTLTKTRAFAAILSEEQFPGPSVQTLPEWKSWVKETFRSQSHTTGTCSMLARGGGGVVDPNLKVYGTTNVRVVDLSVMPQQFSGHPQGLVYAIAEKAADIIKGAI